MQRIHIFIKTIFPAICLAMLQACSGGPAISVKNMVAIVKEMYLADQYIDQTPYILAQTDTLRVYPAIIEKYGYTVEDYENSLRHYLQKDDTYLKILEKAKEELSDVADELDAQIAEIERIRRGPVKWWALDSVKRVAPDELLYDKMLRGLRWLVLPETELVKWRMQDSAIVDIPQNPQWWKNNMEEQQRDFMDFFVRMTEEEMKKAEENAAAGDEQKQLKEDADKKKEDLKKDSVKKAPVKPLSKLDKLKMDEMMEKEEEHMSNLK